ncbi:MAG: TetR/AcrR family transcriptional regulator C-terminal domain-containing protein, partial [Candidatus Saccharibacteria bacterium]|nr:TetR/AcrR family transcriptional regulator C-terminal domain-containing protein [Moraxellaceae bacterium]
HFNDKESLFAASIAAHCVNQLPTSIFDLPESMPITDVLNQVAHRFQSMINSQEAIELHRLMVTIAVQYPERTRLFYDAGPQRTHNEMARLLEQAHQQEKLDIPEPMLAAEYFLSSFTGCSQLQKILGIGVENIDASDRYAREVVKRFIRAYQV